MHNYSFAHEQVFCFQGGLHKKINVFEGALKECKTS